MSQKFRFYLIIHSSCSAPVSGNHPIVPMPANCPWMATPVLDVAIRKLVFNQHSSPKTRLVIEHEHFNACSLPISNRFLAPNFDWNAFFSSPIIRRKCKILHIQYAFKKTSASPVFNQMPQCFVTHHYLGMQNKCQVICFSWMNENGLLGFYLEIFSIFLIDRIRIQWSILSQ